MNLTPNTRTSIAIVCMMLASYSPPALGQEYEIVDLGQFVGRGINDFGDVVGATSRPRAVLWHEGQLIDLGGIGGGEAEATDINNTGLITGVATTSPSNFYSHAFLWDNGTMIDLSTVRGNGLANSIGFALNERGVVAGRSERNYLGKERAFLWETAMYELPALRTDADRAAGHGLNNLHVVVGESYTCSWCVSPVMWTEPGTIVELQKLPGNDGGDAVAINDANVIVGSSNRSGLFDAVRWDGTTAVALPSLGVDFYHTEALDVNNRGTIVGFSSNNGDATGARATRWIGDEVADLNDLVGSTSLILKEANAINNAGQITGRAAGDRAFLLTPRERKLTLIASAQMSAGQNASLEIINGTPLAPVYFFASSSGPGETHVQVLQVTLDLETARLVGSVTIDADGGAAISGSLPANARDRSLYFQAAERGRKSNITGRVIE